MNITSLDYLKKAISNKHYNNLPWVLTAFTKVDTTHNDPIEYSLHYDGVSYYTYIDDTRVILDAKDTPLYKFSDKLEIDNTWELNNTETITTTIGTMLINAILLYSNFKYKIPYIADDINVSVIEDKIVPLLANPDDTILEEYLNFVDSATYMHNFSIFTNVTATSKNILPPEGIDKYKRQVIAELGGTIDTWEKLVEMESRLKAFDKEYLRDDPSLGKFTDGKIANISRKKMFLTLGSEDGFGVGNTPNMVDESLDDGWPTDPDKLTSMFNSSRAGSFSRGVETQKGGVTAKVILRATNSILIDTDDCKTTLGLTVRLNEVIYDYYIGRYINEKGTTIKLTKDNKSKYVNKTVSMRSPMYCNAPINRYCTICAGDSLSSIKTGVGLAVTEISGTILNSSMKKMHGSVLSTAKLSLTDAFS